MSKAQSKQRPKKKMPHKAPKAPLARLVEGVGASLGSLVGMKDLGRDAGSWLARATGLGSYTLHQNTFTKSSANVPQFEFAPDGSVIITHREFVRDIVGSTAFSYFTVDICPTNLAAFPWLSIESRGFEQYEFLGLLACYVPTSGDAIASTNNTLGTLIMATEYDVSRPPFQTKSEMEQYMFVTSGTPADGQIHPVECNPKRDTLNARYMDGTFRTQAAAIDSTAQSATERDVERNLRCTGRLQVATTGQQAATTIGELWWTYRVKLSKPRGVQPGSEGGILHATNALTPIANGSTQFANATVYDDSTSPAQGIGIASDRSTITFYGERPGTLIRVRLAAQLASGSGTYAFGAVTLNSSLTYLSTLFTGTNSLVQTYLIDSSNTTNPVRVVYETCFRVESTAYTLLPSMSFANPTITGGATYNWDLRVTREPYWMANALPTALTVSREEEIQQVVRAMLRAQIEEQDEEEKHVVVSAPTTPKRSVMTRVLGL